MDKNQTLTASSNKRLIGILLGVAILLLIPLIAMLFSNEVKWTLFDFVAAGMLLLSAGLTFEFILRKVQSTKFRILATVVLILVLFLIWAELAVGVFGTPFGGH